MVELLARKRQIAIKDESTEGVFDTGLNTDSTATAFAEFLFGSATWSPSSLQFDRTIVTPSLTPVAQFAPGVTSVELNFTVEMSGHVDNSTGTFVQPPYARLLKFCGWDSMGTTMIPITSFDTGTIIKPNETMTEVAVGTKVFECKGGAISGLHTDLAAKAVTGVPATTEQYDGSDTLTRVTIGVPDILSSWTVNPGSDTSLWQTASIVLYVDGKRVKVKGARATPEFIFEHGKPPRIALRFMGILHEHVDGALLTGTNRPLVSAKDPASYLGVGMNMHDNTSLITVVHNALSLSQGNELILREASGDSDGWSFTGIPSRAFTGSMNFDEQIIATGHDFRLDYENGTPHAMNFTIGTGNGNTFNIRIPSLEYTAMAESERDSVTTWDAQFAMAGREYAKNAVAETTFGEDDEVTIINT